MEPEREKTNVKYEKSEASSCVCRFTFLFSRWYLLLIVMCGLLVFPGCEQSFHPIKKNNQYAFSIYGYLDATADTQWVRVSPARRQLSTDSIPEMTVTLEELETGNDAIMNDSLFTLANGVRFVNVWTTMDVKPEHTYRLQARRPDGATSSVTVSTPADFPMPTLESRSIGCLLTIRGIDRLADVQWIFYFKINSSGYLRERIFRRPRRDKAVQRNSGTYRLLIKREHDDQEILLPAGEIVKSRTTVFIASGGPEWNDDIESLRDIEYALPETGSNIKNGVGYLVGIVSKTIPYECN